MATLKAGTYVFKAVPTVANPAVDQALSYKTYMLTADSTYNTNPSPWTTISSGYSSYDTQKTSIVSMTNSDDSTDFSEKSYEAERGWYQWYFADGTIENRYTATDTTKLRTIIVETDQTVDDAFYTWFDANIEKPRLSVDLTTLSGWASLSAGAHNIQIVAKASGYRDSEQSEAVSVTKASAFKQVPITTSSYNNYKVSLIENMDTTKVYTVYDGDIIDGFIYNNDNWDTWGNVSYGLYIAQQTKTSVTFTMGNSYDWTGGSYVSVIEGAALEGNVQAAKEDFTNIPTTKTLVYVPCFVEGTLIRMADGTDKVVENIRYGDEAQCYDFVTGQKTFAPIDWMIPEHVATKYWQITFSDGSTINLVGSNGKSHRIYNLTKQRFDYPQDFEPSDITVKDDGTTVTIVSCKEIEKTVKFYNIATKDHINVYANGFLTSNRLNNRYKIVDNKFADEQLMSDKDIAAYKRHLEDIRLK